MDVYGIIKATYFTISGWCTAVLLYFLPIKEQTICISIAFVLNFAFGIIAGIAIQHESVQFKKAFLAFSEVAVYLVILTCMFTFGERMKGDAWIFHGLSILTWAWIYFYMSNLSKNLKRLFPGSRGISFLFYVLNLEFIKRIPYLKKFEENEKTNNC